MAFDITKAPTPTSMSPVPYVSALQNLRGNIEKSTARIHAAVAMLTYARKSVMKCGRFVNLVFNRDSDWKSVCLYECESVGESECDFEYELYLYLENDLEMASSEMLAVIKTVITKKAQSANKVKQRTEERNTRMEKSTRNALLKNKHHSLNINSK